MRRLSLLTLLLLFAACRSKPAAPPPEPQPQGQLPRDVRPLSYALFLNVDPRQDGFSGTVEIHIHLERPREEIWMHARDLQIDEATFTTGDGHVVKATLEQKTPLGLARLTLAKGAAAGDGKLTFRYRAKFNPQLRGPYKVTVEGRDYAFTQFEAIDARAAFPCFDDPGFKVPFQLTLTVPQGEVAVSNTPAGREALMPGGLKRVTFAQTVPLPTYLVAFAVGPFDVVDGPPMAPNALRKNPVPVRALAAKGRGPKLARAVKDGSALASTHEAYFGIGFPYPKLDLLAAPDFPFGAMENPGAVVFRDSLLFLDESAGALQTRYGDAVIAHELAHQWFGDLVTLRWWDEAWLNEAFATFMATKALAQWKPESNALLHAVERTSWVMGVDAQVSARSIRQPIGSDERIEDAFDGLTYVKGAQVLRMFERFMGEEKFRLGVRRYLTKHAEGNATTDDLLAALSAEAGRELTGPFHTFLDQPGVPLVTVATRCEGEACRLELAQERYLPVGSTGKRDALWSIPFCARVVGGDGSASDACTLLTAAKGSLALAKAPAFVMPNAGGDGYYQFALAPEDLAKLRAGYPHLSPPERVALASSLTASFNDARLHTSDVLPAFEPFAREREASLARAPMELLSFERDELVRPEQRPAVSRHARQLYGELFGALGLTPKPADSDDDRILRGQLVDFLALDMQDAEVRAALLPLGRAFLGLDSDGRLHAEAVAPDLADSAAAVAVQEGGAPAFDAALKLLSTTEDPTPRGALLTALTSVKDKALSQRALALSLDPRLRRNQRGLPLERQAAMPETRESALRFVEANFERLAGDFTEKDAAFLPTVAQGFCDEAHLEEARAFFTPRVAKVMTAPKMLALALERVSLCIARKKAQAADAQAFFDRTP